MDNLMFSLNATVPVFLMMVLGLVFRKLGWMDTEFANKMNKFVFLVPLPVLVFEDLATVNFAFLLHLSALGLQRGFLVFGRIKVCRANLFRCRTAAVRRCWAWR